MKYTTEGRETSYKGHLFDSYLEACWAAFFDQIGVGYKPHPFNCKRRLFSQSRALLNQYRWTNWTPDFLLSHHCLSEIKPFQITLDEFLKASPETIEAGTRSKMLRFARKDNFNHNVIILCNKPNFETGNVGFQLRSPGNWSTIDVSFLSGLEFNLELFSPEQIKQFWLDGKEEIRLDESQKQVIIAGAQRDFKDVNLVDYGISPSPPPPSAIFH